VTEAIEEEICQVVFIGPDAIYPCVDLGPSKEEGGRLFVCGIRSGHPPAPFQKNWSGEDGPFIMSRIGDFAKL